MREADINRVKRSMEHIMAAITNINSIKTEHRTSAQNVTLEQVKKHLADEYRVLRKLTNDD